MASLPNAVLVCLSYGCTGVLAAIGAVLAIMPGFAKKVESNLVGRIVMAVLFLALGAAAIGSGITLQNRNDADQASERLETKHEFATVEGLEKAILQRPTVSSLVAPVETTPVATPSVTAIISTRPGASPTPFPVALSRAWVTAQPDPVLAGTRPTVHSQLVFAVDNHAGQDVAIASCVLRLPVSASVDQRTATHLVRSDFASEKLCPVEYTTLPFGQQNTAVLNDYRIYTSEYDNMGSPQGEIMYFAGHVYIRLKNGAKKTLDICVFNSSGSDVTLCHDRAGVT